jgi:hypothetical protein
MIQACEDMQRSASEMERQSKDMMEMEGRALGIELDKRKSVRKLWNELCEHRASMANEPTMTWAYVEADMDMGYDTVSTPHVEPVVMETASGVEYHAPPADAMLADMVNNEIEYEDPAMTSAVMPVIEAAEASGDMPPKPSPANHQEQLKPSPANHQEQLKT